MLSMISTLADRADSRPCWLILGNRHEHEIIGGADLEALTERHNVTVVHVISAPGPDWTGRRGRANAEVLDEVLPENRNELEYFICGPDPMMDAAEEALRNLGIPRKAVHAERFGMV